ncbi:unnamed protein product [Euphydryas editha]|uniref:Uncharacterized protein n=1 Tax=Euphydryas editha TaxID=104508 RepID=A0AAU9TGS7_EUPED|nr:unnamed protein product [Euphydryas editha]
MHLVEEAAAVILKLRQEAAARGATYRSALLKAKTSVDLKEQEIGPFRIRQFTTGARLIEIPGSTSGEKTDTLAARLRKEEEVEVLRPEKKSELRISGLRDAVSAERLAIAVAKEGAIQLDRSSCGTSARDKGARGQPILSSRQRPPKNCCRCVPGITSGIAWRSWFWLRYDYL